MSAAPASSLAAGTHLASNELTRVAVTQRIDAERIDAALATRRHPRITRLIWVCQGVLLCIRAFAQVVRRRPSG